MPPLEAMSAGVPVVASRTPAVEEVTAGAAILCDPDDPREWAQRMEHILLNKAEAARLSEAERAAKNAWEFETLLQTERERNSLLARRIAETEQASELANKRFEEMATKLGEIAGLASQLGSGKRRS